MAQHNSLQSVRLSHSLKLRILIPLVIAFVILLSCGLWGMYWQAQQSINLDVQTRVQGANHVLANQLDESANQLIGFQHFIAAHPNLQQAWLARDREALILHATPIYEKINQSNRVTHFYFIDLDQTCFLRIHRPSRFGDKIARQTMLQAINTGKTSYGIELGKFGHFTLRVVKPWFIDGKLVGYIELGEEIEHITPRLADTLDVEVAFAIEKRLLNRQQWEEGLAIMGRKGDWDQLADHVIIDQTFKQVPSELLPLVDAGATSETLISLTDETTHKKFRGSILPLKDAGNQAVGSLVILEDITRQEADLRKTAAMLLFVGCTTGGVLLVICYFYITSLRKTYAQLIQSARQAGKAEIATSVLHNVGNVLNSVNVSAGIIQEHVNHSSVHNLLKGISVMEQHIENLGDYVSQDERGKHLPQFLIDVSHKLSGEEDTVLEEINSLIRNIDHIKSIVASQQKHARNSRNVMEEFSLEALLEETLQINSDTLNQHHVRVIRKYGNVGRIASNRQLLFQILLNLIINAKNACVESNHSDHQITILTQRTDRKHVKIQIQDNGKGISEENLTRIFAHGFTTRENGHGFGLHSAALAAAELKGSLEATSEGPGTGATFTLQIPYLRTGAKLCMT